MTPILNFPFLFPGYTLSKTWVDTKIQSSRQAFLDGLTTGLKGPTGKGRRLIISHIGSEKGFVEGGLLMFEGKKGSEDYHQEMNAERFEEWFRGVLPKLQHNSIVVIDNAPYHSRKVELTPTSAWRKAQIQEWLTAKNIHFESQMVKASLLEIVGKKKDFQKYVVDEMATEHGITLLRLPPYHCELNPIELIWAQVKGHVARNNRSYKMADITKLFQEGLNDVTAQKWSDCVAHVIKEEEKMFKLDNLIDVVTDRLIINVSGDDEESSDSGSE